MFSTSKTTACAAILTLSGLLVFGTPGSSAQDGSGGDRRDDRHTASPRNRADYQKRDRQPSRAHDGTSARADDGRRSRRRGGDDRGGHATARQADKGRDRASTRTHDSGHGRVYGRGSRHSSEDQVAHSGHGHLRGPRHEGRWQHGGHYRGSASSHHRVSIHREYGKGGRHWAKHHQARHADRSHSGSGRRHGWHDHHSRADRRESDHRRADRWSR